MPSDVVCIADLIFEAVWCASASELLFTDRLAWRLMTENATLFNRNGIGMRELCERLENEIKGGMTALRDTSGKQVSERGVLL